MGNIGYFVGYMVFGFFCVGVLAGYLIGRKENKE